MAGPYVTRFQPAAGLDCAGLMFHTDREKTHPFQPTIYLDGDRNHYRLVHRYSPDGAGVRHTWLLIYFFAEVSLHADGSSPGKQLFFVLLGLATVDRNPRRPGQCALKNIM